MHRHSEELTLSRVNVLTTYSASVSEFTWVILISPYISESSGQYLEHFTCSDKRGQGLHLGGKTHTSGATGGRKWNSYPSHLHQFRYHHYTGTVFLPNHPPEIINHLLFRTWSIKRDKTASTQRKQQKETQEESKVLATITAEFYLSTVVSCVCTVKVLL